MTAKLSPMRSIARDALHLLDRAACMEPTYAQDLQEVVNLLDSLVQTNPDLAAQLDPATLSRVLMGVRNGKTLEQALEETCFCA